MNRLNLFAVLLVPALAHAGEFQTDWKTLKQDVMPAPAAVLGRPAPFADQDPGRYPPSQPQEQKTFGKGGYTFESEAQEARAQAERNLREAGVTVLVSRVSRDSNFPYRYNFGIDYLQEAAGPYSPRRVLESYASAPSFTFESDARPEMNSTLNNFRAAGYQIVLGEVRKQSDFPYRYYYQIDYFKVYGPERRPEEPRRDRGLREYRSGDYGEQFRAQLEMNAMVLAFKSQGKEIVRAEMVRRNGRYFFTILYRESHRSRDDR